MCWVTSLCVLTAHCWIRKQTQTCKLTFPGFNPRFFSNIIKWLCLLSQVPQPEPDQLAMRLLGVCWDSCCEEPSSLCAEDINSSITIWWETLHTAAIPTPPRSSIPSLGRKQGKKLFLKEVKIKSPPLRTRAYKAKCLLLSHIPLCLVSWFLIYWVILAICLLLNY